MRLGVRRGVPQAIPIVPLDVPIVRSGVIPIVPHVPLSVARGRRASGVPIVRSGVILGVTIGRRA
jgi:hypothetical protein